MTTIQKILNIDDFNMIFIKFISWYLLIISGYNFFIFLKSYYFIISLYLNNDKVV